MKILLTNDDGITSKGINALVDALRGRHEVSVVAPKSQRSASAHAITVHECIEFEKLEHPYVSNYYSVGGTPADCVKLAALSLFKGELPDLVIAGINDGSNLGSDTIYSGTVSAALEAVYMGMKAIAVSLYSWSAPRDDNGFDRAARFVSDNLDKLLRADIDKYSILNINHPDVMPTGFVTTKLGHHYYSDHYAVVDKTNPNRVQLRGEPLHVPGADGDIAWAKQNYITLSPITLDRNDYKGIDSIKGLELI